MLKSIEVFEPNFPSPYHTLSAGYHAIITFATLIEAFLA
jgi:hypothetical protein